MKFTIALPFVSKFAIDQVEKVRDCITDHKFFIKVNNQNMFCVSSTTKWENSRIYVHVYYNSSAAASNYESFLNDLHQWEFELKNKPKAVNQKYYDKYFYVKETPKRGKK